MRSLFAAAMLVAVVTAAVFGQVRAHEFVRYDDGMHVVNNPHVLHGLSPESVRWAFTTTYFGNWFPVTWLSYLVDSSLYGLNAGGYHLTNLLIHVANALLVLVLLAELTGAVLPALIITLVFAVHPVNVEPVVWISSRKDLLCLFFWLLTFLSYRAYTLKPRASRYALVTIMFLLSLMSKGMAVTLPFVLILMDIWPQRRWRKPESGWVISCFIRNRKLLLEKIPWFTMAGLFLVINWSAQENLGNAAVRQATSLQVGFGRAVANYVLYLEKFFWPARLTPHYPKASPEFPVNEFIVGILVLSAITAVCVRVRRKSPAMLFGWCLFLGVLVPVGGLVPIGESVIAERYLYIPQIGILIAGAFLIRPLLTGSTLRTTLTGIGAAMVIAILSYTSWHQTARWRKSTTLFTYVLTIQPDDAMAHTNLGIVLAESAETRPEGIEHLLYVVRKYEADGALPTQMSMAYNNLATAYMADERFEDALPLLQQAIRANPDNPDLAVVNNLGQVYFQLKDYTLANFYCRRSLELSPNDPQAKQLLEDLGALP